jgi:hypothetical protein
MNDFPVLDSPRTQSTEQHGRMIMDTFGHIAARIDETDGWCSMPLRLTHTQGVGWHLELGPYDIAGHDINRLRAAINAYDDATGTTK